MNVKLKKSLAGRVLIILYYALLLTADVFLMFLIMNITGSILAGLGISIALGIGIGVLGGELEFREHQRMRYKECKRTEEPDNVIDFPG